MTKKTRVFKILIFVLFILFTALVTYCVGVPMVNRLEDPESFREWISEKGLLGELMFVLMVVFQVVVALVPGEPFELGAGYAFGIVKGTLLYYAGVTIGGIIVFYLARKFGNKILEIFFDKKKIDEMKFLKSNDKNRILFFLIFTLPGTPKDLLSYFAGLTEMSFLQWMLISSIGRIPSVMTSIICGNQLGEGKYIAAVITYGVTFLLTAAGFLIYKKMRKNKETKDEEMKNE